MIKPSKVRVPVKGFEGLYEVDTDGNVYSLRAGIILKPNRNTSGYLQYSLRKSGKRKVMLGHRIVAEAFIPNPHNYPIINHKDETTDNNAVSNLEWCSYSYNCTYGSLPQRMSQIHSGIENNKGGIATRKPVIQLTRSGEYVAEYVSISEAHRQTNITISNISNCCLNHRPTAGNYKWKFKEEC